MQFFFKNFLQLLKDLIEKQGLDPLKEILKELGGWPVLMGDEWKDENFNWTNIITKHRQIGSVVFYFMKFEIDKFSENSIRNAIHVIILNYYEFFFVSESAITMFFFRLAKSILA